MLPVPEPLALLDATLLFLIQVLLARHPDLLAPPEAPVVHPAPGLRAARRIFDAVREVHHALEIYSVVPLDAPEFSDDAHRPENVPDDDIPF
ncbi:MAG: hypothetical protein ACREK4_11385 [Candidatus Rokuibacteriota bacterium]